MHGKKIREEHTPIFTTIKVRFFARGNVGISTGGRLDADLAIATHVTLFSSGGQATANTRDIATLLGDLVADDHPVWGGGSVTSSAYDTAWIAMVHHPLYRKRLAFPSALRWLLTHQAENGSWGSLFPYTLLPTLATLLALRRAPHQTVQVARAIEHAQRYLAGALKQWDAARHESVGFEVLAPILLERLAVTGLDWSFPGQDELLALRTRKQPLLSMFLAGQPSTLVHSLEAFVGPEGLDMGVLQRLQSVIMAWVFNHTRGSLLISMVLHASNNTAAALFTTMLFVPSLDLVSFEIKGLSLMVAVALLIILLTRGCLRYKPLGHMVVPVMQDKSVKQKVGV